MTKFILAATDKHTGEKIYAKIDEYGGVLWRTGIKLNGISQPGEGTFSKTDATRIDAHRALDALAFETERLDPANGKSWVTDICLIVAP